MMTKQTLVRWTDAEKMELAETTVKIFAHKAKVPLHAVTLQAMQDHRGFFAEIFANAQSRVFRGKQERMRNIKQHLEVKWLAPMMIARGKSLHVEAVDGPLPKAAAIIVPKPEPVAVPEPVAEAVKATAPGLNIGLHMDAASLDLLAAKLAPLIAKQVADLLADRNSYGSFGTYIGRKATPVPSTLFTAPTPLPENKKVSIVLAGLLPIQQRDVESVWGNRFKFKWLESDHNKRFNAPGVKYAIGMVDFMNHAMDGMLKKRFDSNYIRVNGGVSAIKKALNDLNAKLSRN